MKRKSSAAQINCTGIQSHYGLVSIRTVLLTYENNSFFLIRASNMKCTVLCRDKKSIIFISFINIMWCVVKYKSLISIIIIIISIIIYFEHVYCKCAQKKEEWNTKQSWYKYKICHCLACFWTLDELTSYSDFCWREPKMSLFLEVNSVEWQQMSCGHLLKKPHNY